MLKSPTVLLKPQEDVHIRVDIIALMEKIKANNQDS